MKTFYQVLANNIVASITNFTVWSALVYFVYLETHSVFATSIISGIYLATVAVSGFWLGSLVDHYKKKSMMYLSSFISLAIYVIGLVIYLATPISEFQRIDSLVLWIFVPLILMGVIAGNLRNIVIPTLVTMLVPEDKRDKANGLSGTAGGIAFLIVSVISGILIGFWGMQWVLILAILFTLAPILHLFFVSIPEKSIVHTEHGAPKIDIKGTIAAIKAVPGLLALIIFTTFNNFLGGVFMSLMDAYGLSLVSVQVWGFIWGLVSVAFIVGGLVIAKWGLGKNPVRTLFLTNLAAWGIASVFTLQSNIYLLTVCMFLYLIIMPYIEASEQTIVQKVVPAERQGRVFGFAQSVEQAASPLTAFAIGPLAQFFFIPFMTTGAGVDLIGNWFGNGADRGIALIFTLAGIIGFIITFLATRSGAYRALSQRYLQK